MEILVGVKTGDSSIEDFILKVEYYVDEEIYDSALDYLRRYIAHNFSVRFRELDIDIPDELDEFAEWISDIYSSIGSDNFDDYIDSYIRNIVSKRPEYANLTGKWDVYDVEERDIDEQIKRVIYTATGESKTLEDFIRSLEDLFKFGRIRIIHYDYENADFFAELIVRDLIRDLK